MMTNEQKLKLLEELEKAIENNPNREWMRKTTREFCGDDEALYRLMVKQTHDFKFVK